MHTRTRDLELFVCKVVRVLIFFVLVLLANFRSYNCSYSIIVRIIIRSCLLARLICSYNFVCSFVLARSYTAYCY